MKTLIYVSDIVGDAASGNVPSDLPEILQQSRINNRRLDISGLLTYRQGKYFQILEGPNDTVDQLFASIRKDTRHSSVLLIADFTIQKRSFPDWSMKISATLNKEASMLEFAYRYKKTLNILSNDKLELLRLFFNHPVLVKDSEARAPYDGLQLNITTWPNFANIPPTDLIMDVCAELVQTSLTFEQLVANCEGFTAQEIFEATQKLDECAVLVKTMCAIEAPRASARQQSTLYSKIKSLLAW